MKIVYNRLIPFKGFTAINLFGILFVRKGMKVDAIVMEHERIHTAQMREMLYLPFYLWYGVEWLVRLIKYRNAKKAYHNIGFEREAYFMQRRPFYHKYRRHYIWLRFMRCDIEKAMRQKIEDSIMRTYFNDYYVSAICPEHFHKIQNLWKEFPEFNPSTEHLLYDARPIIMPNEYSDGDRMHVYTGISGEGKEATDEKDNVQ